MLTYCILLQDQHLSSCRYITVECRNTGCGDRVLLSKLEDHLKNECLQRLVECEDCETTLNFNELKVGIMHNIIAIVCSFVEFAVSWTVL